VNEIGEQSIIIGRISWEHKQNKSQKLLSNSWKNKPKTNCCIKEEVTRYIVLKKPSNDSAQTTLTVYDVPHVDSVHTFCTEVAIVGNGSPRQVHLGASLA